MESASQFRFGEHVFPVGYAELSADIERGQPIQWSLFVRAAPTFTRLYDDDEGHERSPHASLELYPLDVRSLDELLATPLVVESGEELAGGGPQLPGGAGCTLYVDMHDQLNKSVIRFVARRGNWLRFEWTADYFRGPVLIQAEAEFTGFRLAERDERAAWALFASRFDPSGWRLHRDEESGKIFVVPQADA